MKTFSQLLPAASDNLRLVQQKWDVTRTCKRCKGEKLVSAFRKNDRGIYEDVPRAKDCPYCGASGVMARPDLPSLCDAVTSVRHGKVQLRSSRPPRHETNPFDMFASRAYFVWRIARFHGGLDVTMPVMADMEVARDPYKNELDSLASACARIFLGSDMAGALRWGPLLGGITQEQANDYMKGKKILPTALSCGPVVIGDKPIEEQMELH